MKKIDEKPKTTLVPAGGKLSRLSRLKTLKLTEITKPLKEETKIPLMVSAFEKILQVDSSSIGGGASVARTKIISFMASTFNPQIRTG